MLSALVVDLNAVPNVTLSSGILRYKNSVWIGDNKPLHAQILQALHSSVVGGHSGFPITYRRVKQHFAWSGMKATTRSMSNLAPYASKQSPADPNTLVY
jgi:hypothetical protein